MDFIPVMKVLFLLVLLILVGCASPNASAALATYTWQQDDMTGVDHFNFYVGTNAPIICATTNVTLNLVPNQVLKVTASDISGANESLPSNVILSPIGSPKNLKIIKN